MTTQRYLFAPQPSTERGRAIQLSACPKSKTMLYTNGRNIIMRDLEHPELASEYSGHGCTATVARYSPSGFYIASGDVQGNIKIWDTTQSTHLNKFELRALSGKINDLDWDFESKRIVAVGEGKDKFGIAFMWDSGSSVGEISGHSKAVNSVSIKNSRPLRAVTGSDDMTVNYYHAVPFKFNKSIKDHSRFVQCVRFAPKGDLFLSAASDSTILLYDAKTGDKVNELKGHTGSVYSCSWSPEGTQVLSGSGDMTAKLWDVQTQQVVHSYTFKDKATFEQQQVGTLWSGSFLVTAALNGDLNYLDPRVGNVVRVLKGHQRGITSLTTTSDKKIVTGSYDGKVFRWDCGSPNGGEELKGHANQIVSLVSSGETLHSCGMDDLYRSTSKSDSKETSTGGIPKGMDVRNNTTALVTGQNELVLVQDGEKKKTAKVDNPTSVAISPSGSEIAVGKEDGTVALFDIQLNSVGSLSSNRGQVTCLKYSPDEKMLAVGDTNRSVLVYDTKTQQVVIDQWVFHSARVNCISWSPNSLHCATGSLDTSVEIWSVEKPMSHTAIKNVHLESVTGVSFLDEKTLVSAGADACIKVHALQ